MNYYHRVLTAVALLGAFACPTLAQTLHEQKTDVKLELGRLYRLKGNPQKAIIYLKDAIALSPNRWSVFFELALAYEALGERGKALDSLEQILPVVLASASPKDIMALAYYCQHLEAYDLALKAYARAVTYSPTETEARLQMGHIYLKQKKDILARHTFLTVYSQQRTANGLLYWGLKATGQSEPAQQVLADLQLQNPQNYLWLLEAQLWRLKGDKNLSLTALEKIKTRVPNTDAQALITLAYLYDKAGDKPTSETLYQRVLLQKPNDSRVLLALGGHLLKTHPEQALVHYLRAYRVFKEKSQGFKRDERLALGYGLRELKAYAQAIDVFESLSNKDYKQHLEMGHTYVVLGQKNKALKSYEQAQAQLLAKKTSPAFAEDYGALAYNLLKLEAYALAEPLAKIVQSLDPGFENLMNLARIALETGQPQAAVAYLSQAEAYLAQDPEAYLYMASLYREAGAYRQSITLLKRAQKWQPSNPELQLALADNAVSLGQNTEAQKEYLQVYQSRATLSPKLRKHLAYGLLQLGDDPKAETLFFELAKQNPRDYDVHLKLGHIYRRKGQNSNHPAPYFNQAERYYNQAEHLLETQEDLLSRKELAFAFFELGKYPRAVPHFETLKRIRPGDYLPPLMLGHSYRLQERFQASADNYRRTLALKPDTDEAWFNLALVARAMGLRAEALRAIDTVSPKSADLQKKVTLIRREMHANGFQLSPEHNYRFRAGALSNELFLEGQYVIYHEVSTDHRWQTQWPNPWNDAQPDIRAFVKGDYGYMLGDSRLDRHAGSLGAGLRMDLYTDDAITHYFVEPELDIHHVNNVGLPVSYLSGALKLGLQPFQRFGIQAQFKGNLLGQKDMSLGSFLNYGAELKGAYQLDDTSSVSYIGGLHNFDFFDGLGQLQTIYKQVNVLEYQRREPQYFYKGVLEINPIFGGVEDLLVVNTHEGRWHLDSQWDIFADFTLLKYFTEQQKTQSYLTPSVGVQYQFPLMLKYPLYLELRGRYIRFFEIEHPGSLHYSLQLRSYL